MYKNLKEFGNTYPAERAAINGYSIIEKKEFLDRVNKLIQEGNLNEEESIRISKAMMKVIKLKPADTPLEIANEDEYIIEGYASTNVVDWSNQRVDPEVVLKGMDEYLGIIYLMHELKNPVGSIIDYEITSEGLWISVEVTDKEVYEAIKGGSYQGFSIGGKATKGHYETGDVLVFDEIRINDISIVTEPDNQKAVINVIKNKDNTKKEQRMKDKDRIVELEIEVNKYKEDIDVEVSKVKELTSEIEVLKTKNEELEAVVNKAIEEAEKKEQEDYEAKLEADGFEPGEIEKMKDKRKFFADNEELYEIMKSKNKPVKTEPKMSETTSDMSMEEDALAVAKAKYKEDIAKKAKN